eukprot:m.217727 g.217727  ORF g.217727 m.217727 type:complete len:103 (+) comp25697_c2_seq6:115-423(+)
MGSRVKVAVRVRPFSQREQEFDQECVVTMRDNQVRVHPQPPCTCACARCHPSIDQVASTYMVMAQLCMQMRQCLVRTHSLARCTYMYAVCTRTSVGLYVVDQ